MKLVANTKPWLTPLFISALLLISMPVKAADTVSFTDTAYTINAVTQSSWTSLPADTLEGNTVWNGDSNRHEGNSVTIDYANPPASFSDPDHVIGGVSTTNSNVSHNTVFMVKGTVSNSVYGGYSAQASADYNTVTMTGGTVSQNIYGGGSMSSARSNIVNMSSGAVSQNIYGGSASTEAADNTVNMNGGTVSQNIYGGSAFSEANNNQVNINGGTVGAYVYGGSATFRANRNTVNVTATTGSSASEGIYGGRSSQGEAIGNTVNIRGGTIAGPVVGAEGVTQTSGNIVNMEGGNVNNEMLGGFSENGAVNSNTVNISGGTLDGGTSGRAAFGGYSTNGMAEYNTVNISNGQVNGSIYGGYSVNGAANSNTVTMAGGEVSGDVYGGYSVDGAAINNIINISGTTVFEQDATLFGGGGMNPDADVFSGNTLNLETQVSVAQAGNFEHYNFFLPSTLGSNEPMLTITGFSDAARNSDTNINNVAIYVDVQATAPVLQAGDVIRLIEVDTPAYQLTGTPASFEASQGITILYDVEVEQTDRTYDLRIQGGELRPSTRVFSEGMAASLAFVGQGGDLLVNQGMNSALKASASPTGDPPVSQADDQVITDYCGAFGAIQGGAYTYDTGSHIKVEGVAAIAGLTQCFSFSPGVLMAGVFVEGGFGNYNSNHSFPDAASINGDGDSHYVGGGLLGRFSFAGGFYSEASVRMGYTHSDFSSLNMAEKIVSYDYGAMYIGAHLGLGYAFLLTDNIWLDVYGKYLFTRVNSDDVSLYTGEEVHFDAATSQRGRVGARLGYRLAQLTPYVGAAYDYEFDGDIKASIHGMGVDQPSLRGGSGMLEVGFNWRPVEGSPWSLDFGVEGYAGTRQGLSGGVQINYAF